VQGVRGDGRGVGVRDVCGHNFVPRFRTFIDISMYCIYICISAAHQVPSTAATQEPTRFAVSRRVWDSNPGLLHCNQVCHIHDSTRAAELFLGAV
jgi:hypothetical protein